MEYNNEQPLESADQEINSTEKNDRVAEEKGHLYPKAHPHLGTIAYILVGLLVAVLAIYSGYYLGKRAGASGRYAKLNAVLDLINEVYVDDISSDSIQEVAIPQILGQLDPHSTYLEPQIRQSETERLEGAFSGIGVQFNTILDTVVVVHVIKGGPSARAGIRSGDRIVGVSGYDLTQQPLNEDSIRSRLRGEEGSIADLKVKRQNKELNIRVARGYVPVNSLEVAYEITPGILYAKLNGWGRTTHKEFLAAVSPMLNKQLKGIILDLRGNGGGYLEAAAKMCNEFLEKGQEVLHVEGKAYPRETLLADGKGILKDIPLTVLVDDFSASSSEIFAGAMQDHDRATIVGRRTFGKGFVQQPYDFADGSEVRLTVARYFTPSGRCIQKAYEFGNSYEYGMELQHRYENGDWDKEPEAPQNPELLFRTTGGRVVYGGGGISPDVFIPRDTAGFTNYYLRLLDQGAIPKFAFVYADRYRAKLQAYKGPNKLRSYLSTQNLLSLVGNYGHKEGVPLRPNALYVSRNLILRQVYALIAEQILGRRAMWTILNESDHSILKCVEIIENQRAYPLSRNREE